MSKGSETYLDVECLTFCGWLNFSRSLVESTRGVILTYNSPHLSSQTIQCFRSHTLLHFSKV